MAAILPNDVPPQRIHWGRVLAVAASVFLGLGLALSIVAWWNTESLDEPPASIELTTIVSAPADFPVKASPTWPEGTLDGREAKVKLLDILGDASRRIDRVEGYTATFKKQERIGGKLLPEQTLAMKVRQRPFAIYFKYLKPKAGKEVVYAEGHHGNKVIAHNGDWTRRLVPRLAVDPTSAVALADSRHPITEAGLTNLARKLIAFRKLDLEDPEAVTVLDRVTLDGKPWLRSVHHHPNQNPARPYARVEVLYDPTTLFPLRISSYDWLAPGQAGDFLLAERYAYEDLAVDPPLTALDFDPANPSYEFLRF